MIAIIDYGIGNIGSIANALKLLGEKYEVSDDASIIESADAIILPGVGAAGAGMWNLKSRGLDKIILSEIKKGKPFLGICLGMQLLFEYSEEANTTCLGILAGSVKRFRRQRKVPQIGWNQVIPVKTNPFAKRLFSGIPTNSEFYFVNSYYPVPSDASITAATTEYGEKFVSVIATKNMVATQFHPEKSGDVGFQLLKNFIKEYI